MNRKLVIDAGTLETRIALLQDDVLAEYETIDPAAPAPDMFYRGKVLRVDASMDAAFVDIGESLSGFLPRAGKRYRQGDLCLVQIEAIPSTETKGVRLTDRPHLTGRYMVLQPGHSGVRVSQKLSESKQRAAKVFAETRCPNGFGLIIRTEWQELKRSLSGCFDRELAQLLSEWETIRKQYAASQKPGRLTDNPEIIARCMPILSDPDAEIAVNQTELLGRLAAAAAALPKPGALLRDETTRGPLIFDPYQIDTAIERARHRKLWLKSGGFVIVDYPEAFTVYDVNSGKDIRKLPPEEKAYAVNLEACEAILAHMRLCNIGGIVLIDLIDMQSQENRDALLEAVRTAAKADHGNVHEEGITSLGILQLTRRRTGLPLHMQIETACRACQGAGRHLSERQTEGEIRRAIARRIQSGQRSGYRIRCSKGVQALIRQDPFFDSVDLTLQTDRDYEIESLAGTGSGKAVAAAVTDNA